jgi:hypothetical protein
VSEVGYKRASIDGDPVGTVVFYDINFILKTNNKMTAVWVPLKILSL